MKLFIFLIAIVTMHSCTPPEKKIRERKPIDQRIKTHSKIKRNRVNIVIDSSKFREKHSEALRFCSQNDMNDNFYFFCDMSIHSGKNRFFVYDFIKARITNSALVTHGVCDVEEPNDNAWEIATFSNTPNSHCSSIGKYKIGKRDYSNWGINIKYWLHGLEKTNNTAINRVVVLHSWGLVENKEIYPHYSPLSWGCPAVSNEFMKELDEILKVAKKPVLLWIFK